MKSNKVYTALILMILMIGFGLLLYPSVSDYVNTYRYEGKATNYIANTDDIQEETYETQLASAMEFNEWLTKFTSFDAAMNDLKDDDDKTYEHLLSFDEEGVIGVISIPDYHIFLPVYHGSDEATLQKGVGHLMGSSLPIGGKGTHAVLTGHTGLSSAKIFTQLDGMKNGDVFYLTIMGETLKYEVDKISIVKPDQVEQLSIDKNEDYVTLVTCTPYGINTERLLVRGTRVPYAEELNQQQYIKSHDRKTMIIVSVAIGVVAVIGFVLGIAYKTLRTKKSKKKER